MDRRTFNKALSGLFAGALIPISTPLVAKVVSNVAHTPSHFGLTHVGLTTNFSLESVMGLGQLEVYPDLNEEPQVDGEFAFYSDVERTIEKTVFFESKHKSWSVITDPTGRIGTKDSNIEGGCIADKGDHRENRHRVFYEMKSLEVFLPNGGNQIDLMNIQKDQRYDIILKVGADTQGLYSVTMKDSLINDIVTVSDNENNFQS
jgi:hypothetical protein